MSYQEHLSDLKASFPGAKVLYAPEIAVVLNKSPTAIRRMLDKRQIPELKTYGGKLGVSVVNLARFLDEGDSPAIEAPAAKTAPKERKRSSSAPRSAPRLKDLMALAARQVAFWNDLHAALETISLRGQDKPFPKDSKSL